tara:strand:- start:119535 stop:119816 length:282 start_codon:yes stop_codon:yes gene_type:complete
MTKLDKKAHLYEENNKNKQNTLSVLASLLEHIQRYNDVIDLTEDKELFAIFEYQRKVAKEQVAMLTEWMRRNDEDFQKSLSVYLFSEKPLVDQ